MIEKFYQIANKRSETVPFILNNVQRDYDLKATNRDIILKARQEGFSSLILARFSVKCMTVENTRAVVISHEKESTQRLLYRAKFYLEHPRHGRKARMVHASKNEMVFPETDSMFYIGTAGTRKFGRGDTITDLHCSEIAFWPDAATLVEGLFQAVPYEGRIVMESTANGMGDYYHKQCISSLEDKSRFKLHFYPWHIFPEYTLPVAYDFEMTEEELELVKTFNLTPGQIMWRREKLPEFRDLLHFQQDYPQTIEEAFIASGFSYFPHVKPQPLEPKKWEGDRHALVYKEPERGHRYSIGVDSSAGVGSDNACIQIMDCYSFEQVFEYAYDRIEPELLGEKAIRLGRWYNDAFITVEANSHGLATLNVVKKGYPHHRLYRRKTHELAYTRDISSLGWLSTSRTKPYLCSDLRAFLADGLMIYSSLLTDELSTFVEDENGKLGAQAGCKDDRVIALALAMQGYKEVPHTNIKEASVIPPEVKPGQVPIARFVRTIFDRRRAKEFIGNEGLV